MTEEIIKLKPGDIFWDGNSWCLVFLDLQDDKKLKNVCLDNFTVSYGNLQNEDLENCNLHRGVVGNINNINKELFNIFNQKGAFKDA